MRSSRALAGALALLIVLSACGQPAGSPSSSAGPGETASAVPPSPGGGTFSPTPGASESPVPSGGATDEPAPTASPPTGTTYTVRPGDSLSSIARSFGTTTALLQAWNADQYPSLATNPNVIEPGWVLVVSGDPNVTPIPTPSPPPATPRPTAPPGGSGCTAGNRVAAGSAQTFKTIPNAGPGVAFSPRS